MKHLGLSRWVLLGAVCAPIGTLEYLNFTGFCYGEGRYYSGNELINRAVQRNISTSKIGSRTMDEEYATADEFRQENPDCCIIHQWGHPFLDPIWVRIFGFYVVIVEVWYRLADQYDPNYGFYHSEISINACGKILKARGIPELHGRIVPETSKDKSK